MSDSRLSESKLLDSDSRTRNLRLDFSNSDSRPQTRSLGLVLSYLRFRTWTLELELSDLESRIRYFRLDLSVSSATIAIGVREFTNTDTRGEVLEDSETRSEILCPSVLLRILFGDSECENSSPKARVQDFEYESFSLRIGV